MIVTDSYRDRIKTDSGAAERYLERKSSKHQAEMNLITRAVTALPPARYLDIPCGTGRASILLARLGNECRAADLGDGVITVAKHELYKAGVVCRVDKEDIEQMTYADQAFDNLLVFRLFHHFPNEDVRQRVVAELCRVAKSHVLISYLSPHSVTSIKRRLRAALGGKVSRQHATSLKELEGYFREQGFELANDYSRAYFIHSLHLAVFRRIPPERNDRMTR